MITLASYGGRSRLLGERVTSLNGGSPGQSRAQVELGVTLRRLRREHGLSQRAVTRPLNLGSHSVIVDWEAGRRPPPAGILTAYERHFGLAPGHLLKLRERVLAERAAADAEASLTAAIGAAEVPRQLPCAVAHFVGRASALAELDRMLPRPRQQAAPVISVISGMAGVGKTTLAVHFAQRVAARFPDGQLYVNLRGFDPSGQPVSPAAAIRGFLDALQVPAARIPPDLDAQAALYRSLLAGRRMLIVADNARDAAQVRPLLPGTPGCLVLVTSRAQLTGLAAADGARLLDLDLLTPDEARDLLAARLGAGRVAAEPGAVTEIITGCGRLPLALAIVAARAAAQPGFPLSALTAGLRDSPLDVLAAGDDLATDARAVFALSYRALAVDAARLFRLLSLHPGPDISVRAAASLAGLSAAQTRSLLAALSRAHLIAETSSGRYAFHDLLRAYAGGLAQQIDSTDQRHASMQRLLDHYLHSAHAADLLLEPSRDPIALPPPQPGTRPEVPGDRAAALAWFTAEQDVLLACIGRAGPALDAHAWRLAWTLWTFLDHRGLWHAQAASQRAGLAAAIRLGDRLAQAHCLRNLAQAHAQQGRPVEAETCLRQALDLYAQAGDYAGQAAAHNNLAIVCGQDGRDRQALDHAQQALGLCRIAGNKTGQPRVLNLVGWCHAQLGDYQRAITACEQALALHQQVDYPQGQAGTWDTLGFAYQHLGQHDRAIACYQRALGIYRDLGHRYYVAGTLTRLAEVWYEAGDTAAARDAWQQALAILGDLDHPDAETVRARIIALRPSRSDAGPA